MNTILLLGTFVSATTLLLAPSLRAAETARESVLQAMALRRGDPWPRGNGHVVLAIPGSVEEFKGYHEPGGSFSPAFGSFGISLWVIDNAGRRVTTSDALPMEQIEQSLVWPDQPGWPRPPAVPGVRTRTPYYDLTWTSLGEGRWQLRLRCRGTNATQLLVRSVGPAGAPLTSLHWFKPARLFVSDRWSLSFNPGPVAAEVVPPRGSGADPSTGGVPVWKAEADWGYARFTLLKNQEYFLTIDDSRTPPANPLTFSQTRANLKLDLPDRRFEESLHAQVAHLMMGLVGDETRPGEPNNYPLNWLRDGAYVIVALARAGQVEVAKQLCGPFLRDDFFGGFGAEADAPGLALWALTEVAAIARDEEFTRQVIEAGARKHSLIEEMLKATGPVRKQWTGPLVPGKGEKMQPDLVCDAAKAGLIVGKMDGQRPVLFVNAVAYAGLQGYARLLGGGQSEAPTAQEIAKGLRTAWAAAFNSPEAGNDRTYICGHHPAWIVSDRDAYRQKLLERRAKSHDAQDRIQGRPLWTYFNLAEAHQWLVLGGTHQVWNDLLWFWEHQASPGLYTWWEGNGEENTFKRWEHVRGWVRPPGVTPHYWTAAEMLLLQLDMLAYLDESNDPPHLVIGAGIPAEWLAKPLRVKGLRTRLGGVDWEWTRSRLNVRLHGPRCEVKAGPAFPAGTSIIVKD